MRGGAHCRFPVVLWSAQTVGYLSASGALFLHPGLTLALRPCHHTVPVEPLTPPPAFTLSEHTRPRLQCPTVFLGPGSFV